MSIHAEVTVLHDEDGSVRLKLVGQTILQAESAPYEVTALNGLTVWGSGDEILLGSHKIAKRTSDDSIEFVDKEAFKAAVIAYHKRAAS